MIFRVYPQEVKIRYRGGQYGALGLYLPERRVDGIKMNGDSDRLIKRAYSVSNSLLDDHEHLALPQNMDYYEFYIDLVQNSDEQKFRLSPRLFALKDGDKLFLGSKIVGHYTLESKAPGRNLLLVSTTTGEAPHNSIITEALNSGDKEAKICAISLWPKDQESMYKLKHEKLQKQFSQYRYRGFQSNGYEQIESLIRSCLSDAEQSKQEIGWPMSSENTHIFLCGDPRMIGAPVKLGAWKYEYPEYGLMRILEEFQFTPVTRFQPGNISYESYW